MISLVIVLLAIMAVWISVNHFQKYGKEDISSPKTSTRLNKLWTYVDKASKAGRKRAMERALLAILRIDHKNTAAYNRLGMLYAKEGNFDDAIDCFAIASSLTPTVATLYNLGLVYYEKGNYKEASTAFERVVDLEPDVKRYIAYAKALHKLGNTKRVADTLEKVVALEPTASNYDMLAQAYKQNKDFAKSEDAIKDATKIRSKKLVKRRAKEARPKLARKVS